MIIVEFGKRYGFKLRDEIFFGEKEDTIDIIRALRR